MSSDPGALPVDAGLVEVGVFAHNEAAGIEKVLRGLLAQDLFAPHHGARLLLLANGCTDDTAALARAIGHRALQVAELAEPGKSRTWNRFVHQLSGPQAEVLIFADADISLPDHGALRRLVQGLRADPQPFVLSSRPVKDIALAGPSNMTERIIAASAGGLDDWQQAICGQLYAMPAQRARQFHLPIGLPVEDGFLRAMVLTDHLTGPETPARLGGLMSVHHIYPSERTLPALVRHQTRIVIGSAINAAVFAALRALPPGRRAPALQEAAQDPGWLGAVLGAQLPRLSHGYVPPHFAFKRLARLFAPGQNRNARAVILALTGFVFDLIVYILAQIRMFRGTGVGHW